MQRRKKILLFSALFFLVVCFYFMQETYAKYITTSEGKINAKIARWNIKVNETDIKNNASLAQDIIPTFEKSENIAENVIAPTIKGYFDLNMDFADADVSFSYNISIAPSETSSVSDLVIKGSAIDSDIESNNITYFDSSFQTISGKINLADNIKSRVIRVYIVWDDTSDTTLGSDIHI